MPELIEELYCSQQIVIPPKFPFILKQYAKSAIKTQPYDLLRWSYEYFKALSEGKKPPVKLRIEYPIYATEGGLTRGYLKVLANQLEGITSIPLDTLFNLWKGACLDPQELTRILCLCSVYKRCSHLNYLYFFAVASALLTKNVTNTMILACDTLTKEPEGGSAAIPADNFIQMYLFIAEIDASKPLRYINGYLEGHEHSVRTTICEDDDEEEAANEEAADMAVTISSTTTNKDKLREMSGSQITDETKPAMVAGRQMSTTSGEFVVQYIEKEVLSNVDEHIAILPDPALKKRKAKPDEVEMIRELVSQFLDDVADVIVADIEELEEEEATIPEVTVICPIPGIGPVIEDIIVREFCDYVNESAAAQSGLFMPRNMRYFLCPPLEKFPENIEEDLGTEHYQSFHDFTKEHAGFE